MVNTDDFIKRLEVLLDYYGLSASLFADKLGVQRSGLSHLMSGRNKPSLDFVMKIAENFPEVDLYWLLAGTGEFPKKENQPHNIPQQAPAPPVARDGEGSGMPNLFSETIEPTQKAAVQENKINLDLVTGVNDGSIDRIVVFYSNGSFKSYTPQN